MGRRISRLFSPAPSFCSMRFPLSCIVFLLYLAAYQNNRVRTELRSGAAAQDRRLHPPKSRRTLPPCTGRDIQRGGLTAAPLVFGCGVPISVHGLVLDGPAVNESGLNSFPVGVGGISGVSGQSGDNGGSPGVHVGGVVERPGHSVLAVSQQRVAVNDELVGGSGAVLEGNSAQLLDQDSGCVGIGDQPIQEVQRSLDVLFLGLAVDRPAVLGAGAQK